MATASRSSRRRRHGSNTDNGNQRSVGDRGGLSLCRHPRQQCRRCAGDSWQPGCRDGTAGGRGAAPSQPVRTADFGAIHLELRTSMCLSSANSVIASGTLSPGSGAEIAIAYPVSVNRGRGCDDLRLSAGTAATGDSFTLTPGGPGSNGNIVALADLANQSLLSGQTFGDYYSGLVTNIGSRGEAAQVAAQTTQAVLTQTQTYPAIRFRGQPRSAGGRSGQLSTGLPGGGKGDRYRPELVPKPARRRGKPRRHRMQISTNQFLLGSMDDLLAQQSNINQLNRQISTGQTLLTATSDPAGAGEAVGLASGINRLTYDFGQRPDRDPTDPKRTWRVAAGQHPHRAASSEWRCRAPMRETPPRQIKLSLLPRKAGCSNCCN